MHSRTGSLTCHPVELCRTLWWGIVNSYCAAIKPAWIAILWFTATATIENCLELSTRNRPLVTYSEYFSASSVALSYWWQRAWTQLPLLCILYWRGSLKYGLARSDPRNGRHTKNHGQFDYLCRSKINDLLFYSKIVLFWLSNNCQRLLLANCL